MTGSCPLCMVLFVYVMCSNGVLDSQAARASSSGTAWTDGPSSTSLDQSLPRLHSLRWNFVQACTFALSGIGPSTSLRWPASFSSFAQRRQRGGMAHSPITPPTMHILLPVYRPHRKKTTAGYQWRSSVDAAGPQHPCHVAEYGNCCLQSFV